VKMGFWGRSLTLIFLMIAFAIIFVVVGDIMAVLIFGKDDVVHMSVPVLLLVQAFISVGLFVLPAGALCFLCRKGDVGQRLGVSPRPHLASIIICVGIMIVSAPLVSWLEEINLRMVLPDCMKPLEDWMRACEDDAANVTKRILASDTVGMYLINILVLAIIPAVGEELTFRMGLQQTIFTETTRMGRYWCAVLAAAIFSAIHLQFFGFLPRFLLGIFLGVMLIETNGVLCSVIAHFVNNMLAVSVGFAEARGIKMDIDAFMEHPATIAASALGCVALFVLLHRSEKKVLK